MGVDRPVDLYMFPEWPAAREIMEYIEAANDRKEDVIDRYSPQRGEVPGKG